MDERALAASLVRGAAEYVDKKIASILERLSAIEVAQREIQVEQEVQRRIGATGAKPVVRVAAGKEKT